MLKIIMYNMKYSSYKQVSVLHVQLSVQISSCQFCLVKIFILFKGLYFIWQGVICGCAGPRLFLACPMDMDGSQVWFTDLWNYSLVPYLLEAVREGLQIYGSRAPWEDPTLYICQTYPWVAEALHGGLEALIRYIFILS